MAASARRAARRPGGLYIDEPVPQAQPDEEDDLEELAKWLHLAEVLRAEEATRQAALREEEGRHLRLKKEAELGHCGGAAGEGGGAGGTPG
jgi:hypothetical protein